MGKDSIDQLQIEINSSAKGASESIDKLVETLTALKSGVSGVTGSLDAISSSIGKLKNASQITKDIDAISKSLKGLSGIDFKSSGITNAINSINRLSQVDMKIDTKDLYELSAVINSIGKTGKNYESISNFINALHRLTKSSNEAKNASKNLKDITGVIRDFASSMNTVDPSEGILRFLEALAQITSKTSSSVNAIDNLRKSLEEAKEEAKETAEEMSKVPKAQVEPVKDTNTSIGSDFFNATKQQFASFSNTLNKAPTKINAFSSFLQKAFPNAAGAIKSATTALNLFVAGFKTLGSIAKTVINAVNRSFDFVKTKITNLVTTIGNGARAMGTFATNVRSVVSNMNPFSGMISKITSSLGSMAGMMIGFYGLRSLATGLKSVVDYGSDITEVENIVDTAFGRMAKNAYDFADTAITQFGLSRLEALRFSGTLMSMFKSSGVAQKDAAQMSTTLAGLAGDLASFYNNDAQVAFQKLQSGIMDSAKSLKVFGLSVTKANLEEFALSQGITQSYNSMTQAEKVMLRYNYIMAATSAQQGDFAKTAGRLCAA